MKSSKTLLALFLVLAAGGCGRAPDAPRPVAQFPSPMQEGIRAHERVDQRDIPGASWSIEGVLSRPIEVFLPERWAGADSVDLVVHFHGASFVVEEAVNRFRRPLASAVVNLGSGSSVYERPFLDAGTFLNLVSEVKREIGPRVAQVHLTSWSAGYGAVRAILGGNAGSVSSVVLLDGLHTDYVPDRVTLHDGGTLNDAKLDVFLSFARQAAAGERRMLITHSEVFPGTYASTTETASWLSQAMEMPLQPVIQWGPVGMQKVGQVTQRNLSIVAFAGNTAPDHVDHFHGLPEFLALVLAER